MNKHISKTSQKLSLHYSKSLVFLQNFSKVFVKFIEGMRLIQWATFVMVTIVKRIICVLFSLWKKLMYRHRHLTYRKHISS